MRSPLLFAPAAAALLVTTAQAQLPDVAIVAAAENSLTNCRYTDVQSYLLASGLFASVDIVDCVSTTPSLMDLMPYDGLLTWTNTSYDDGDALGNVFADYHDAGGAVVVAVFGTTTPTTNRFLGGRWITGGYEVIQTQLGNTNNSASLGAILVPGHPTVAGVSSLSAGLAFRPDLMTPLVQGTVIAQWDDGSTLIAEGAMARRVDLGLYPPSNVCSSSFWDAAGDGDLIVANSLAYAVAGGAGIGSNYCAANPNSTGSTASMSAAGSANVVDNDVTLTASSLPLNTFGFFLTSLDQGFVSNPAGSQGNLCLAGSIGRYVAAGEIQNSGLGGEISLTIDLTSTPTPIGPVAVAPGQTWNFTAWYRDSVMATATSNFADGYEIEFL
ncbi:MAG: hypothetical protein AAF726_05480 [Planctomycetota bacterium]